MLNLNSEMRDSADAIQQRHENHANDDRIENYGGNTGDESNRIAKTKEEETHPELSGEQPGKQASMVSKTTEKTPASTPISGDGGEKASSSSETIGRPPSLNSSSQDDADSHFPVENHDDDAIRKNSRKGLPVQAFSEKHRMGDGQENQGDVQSSVETQNECDITPPEASVSGTNSRKGKADRVRAVVENHLANDSICRTNSADNSGGEDDGHHRSENHKMKAIIDSNSSSSEEFGEGHFAIENQSETALPDNRFADPLVLEIVQLYRMRRRWMKARNALILQGKSFARALSDGDKDVGSAAFERVFSGKATDADAILVGALMPFIPAIERFDVEMSVVEKHLGKLAKKLPIAPYVESVKGLSFAALASIVGEAGDLSEYRSVSAIWKRLGLAVIDGDGRQRKCANLEQAEIHGYSPARRSAMWNIGNSLILGMGKFRPVYGEDIAANQDYTYFQKVFAERARYEAERLPHKDGTAIKKSKTDKDSYTAHAAARAKRYTEKRLLRCLFAEWRRVKHGEPVNIDV